MCYFLHIGNKKQIIITILTILQESIVLLIITIHEYLMYNKLNLLTFLLKYIMKFKFKQPMYVMFSDSVIKMNPSLFL